MALDVLAALLWSMFAINARRYLYDICVRICLVLLVHRARARREVGVCDWCAIVKRWINQQSRDIRTECWLLSSASQYLPIAYMAWMVQWLGSGYDLSTSATQPFRRPRSRPGWCADGIKVAFPQRRREWEGSSSSSAMSIWLVSKSKMDLFHAWMMSISRISGLTQLLLHIVALSRGDVSAFDINCDGIFRVAVLRAI